VRGHEAHSSLTPRGVNAVQIGCDIVAWIGVCAQAFRVGHRQDPAYDVPYTTLHVGVIHGGTAVNIVARDCMFEIEMRHLPFDDPEAFLADLRRHADALLPAMRAVAPATFIEFDELSGMPGFENDGRNAIVDIARACCKSGLQHKVSFGTEAALFDRAAIPAVICGPGHIEQAHQPNEWVSLEQLARCEAFMHRLAQHLCVE
jgi:acetylornithine deacetylase